MDLSATERRYLETARVGRLATADAGGRPHVVPVCFALDGGRIVTPIDEKPKDAPPESLRRVRDIEANPAVSLVADHWSEDWDRLGWVQVRGRAALADPDTSGHAPAVAALRSKYDQYADHDLEARPVIRIDPGHAVSWGRLHRPGDEG